MRHISILGQFYSQSKVSTEQLQKLSSMRHFPPKCDIRKASFLSPLPLALDTKTFSIFFMAAKLVAQWEKVFNFWRKYESKHNCISIVDFQTWKFNYFAKKVFAKEIRMYFGFLAKHSIKKVSWILISSWIQICIEEMWFFIVLDVEKTLTIYTIFLYL